jgi:hypothetical protein
MQMIYVQATTSRSQLTDGTQTKRDTKAVDWTTFSGRSSEPAYPPHSDIVVAMAAVGCPV